MRQWSLTIGVIALLIIGVGAAFGGWLVDTLTEDGSVRVAARDTTPRTEVTDPLARPVFALSGADVRPILRLYPDGATDLPLPTDGQCRQTLVLADHSLSALPLLYATPEPTPTPPAPPAVGPTLTPTPPPGLARWRGRPVTLVADGVLSLALPAGATVRSELTAQISETGLPDGYARLMALTLPTSRPDPDGRVYVRLDGHARGVLDPSAAGGTQRVDHHRLLLTLDIAGIAICDALDARWERPPQAELWALSGDPATEWEATLPVAPAKQVPASISVSAVRNLSCSRESTTTALVGWNAPATVVGTTIARYRVVSYEVVSLSVSIEVPETRTSYTISGLTPGVERTAVVRAIGADGTLGDDLSMICPAQ